MTKQNKCISILCIYGINNGCFEPPRSSLTHLGSIILQGRLMNVPVYYHQINMVLCALFSYNLEVNTN